MVARITSILLFSSLARDNLHLMKRAIRRAERLQNADIDRILAGHEVLAMQEGMAKYAAGAIIFSAIAVEAYIYDYAARHLSDSYAQSYVDKLDPASKWMVVPRLVEGRDLPNRGKWLPILKNLAKQRNLIVHNKSMEVRIPIKAGDSLADKLYRSEIHILKTAEQCATS